MAAKAPGRPKGIDVHKHQLWILNYVLGGKRPILTPPSGPEKSDPGFFGGGSPNMKGLYPATWLAWAFITGAHTANIHLDRAIARMKQELLAHGSNEFGSSSHQELWISFIALMLWVAEKYELPELRQLCVDWFREETAYWRACDTERGPWIGGGRGYLKGHQQGTNPARTMAQRLLVQGIKPRHDDQYDVGADLLARLPNDLLDEIQVWPKNFSPVLGGVDAKRWADGDFYLEIGPSFQAKQLIHCSGRLNGALFLDDAGLDFRREAFQAKGTPQYDIYAPDAMPAPKKEE